MKCLSSHHTLPAVPSRSWAGLFAAPTRHRISQSHKFLYHLILCYRQYYISHSIVTDIAKPSPAERRTQMDTENLEKEMNRGFLQLVILIVLETPMYGYMMMKDMEEKGVSIEESTLYPLMRRLESQGLLTSRWDTSENKARKYYQITEDGRVVRDKLADIVRRQSMLVEQLKGGDIR